MVLNVLGFARGSAVEDFLTSALLLEKHRAIAAVALTHRSRVLVVPEDKWVALGLYFNNKQVVVIAEAAMTSIDLSVSFVDQNIKLEARKLNSSVLLNVWVSRVILFELSRLPSYFILLEEISELFRLRVNGVCLPYSNFGCRQAEFLDYNCFKLRLELAEGLIRCHENRTLTLIIYLIWAQLLYRRQEQDGNLLMINQTLLSGT